MAFTVLAWWQAQDGLGDRLMPLLQTLQAESIDEPGCLAYEVHLGIGDPDTFLLYEVYVDEAAYEAHQRTNHFMSIGREQAMPLLADRRREFHTRLRRVDTEG